MARTPRGVVLNEEIGGVYHCINRCVRRAFLCGGRIGAIHYLKRQKWVRSL